MGLISEAHAQAAEATKIAVDAGTALLEYRVLGAFCVLLIITVGIQAYRHMILQDRYAALIERVVGIAESSKATSASTAAAMATLVTSLTETTKAVQDLAHEAEGEARENRHLLGNVAGSIDGLMKRLDKVLDRGAQ